MIKTLAKSIREYKWVSLITPLFMLIEVAMEAAIVYVAGILINKISATGITNDELLRNVYIYGAILAGMAMVSLGSGALGAITGAKASAGFAKNLRHDIFYKIQDFSFENIDSFQTSSLVTRLTTDIANIQMAYQMLLRITIRVPLQMATAIVLAFRIDSELPWLYIIIIPFLAFALFGMIRVVMPIFKKLFKKYDKVNNSVGENIKGIRVVKSYVREDYEINKLNAASDELCKDFTFVERILAFNNPIMQLAIHVAILFASYFGAKAVCTHTSIFGGASSMQVGDFTIMLTYGTQILSGLMMLSFIFVMMSISYECCVRACEVLNTNSNLVNPENPVYEVADGSVDFNHVSFKYKKEAENFVMTDIDLHIPSGATVGIIGGTGSSKTTLVNLISRLYDTTEGEVFVGGLNVRDYDLETLRNQVAVVLQKNVLFSGTIAENLRWGNLDATDEELVEACKLAQADEFIQTFPEQYNTHIEQGGTNVSGGQKQRLCIARALLKKPKVLILDDSTSAVDTKTDALIRKGFKEFIPTTTKIIIAQRISSVQDADMIVVLDGGKINGVGTHDELLKSNAIYQEVYYTQNKEASEKAGDINA